ncbi:MAG TPA: FmdB family zinc ribbon protein [Solirubrobacteraceae bacterium]|jgi:putative FmdB family regulatory protein|nr:FmdB family zinc ribbon protein [Solirubrobacteraceae bacterium]
MPLYDYLCARCGPFEARADVSAAGAGVACPACESVAARAFTSPGGRGPRRQRQLEGLTASAVARVDRSTAGGGASVGAMPDGVRIDRSGHAALAPVHMGRPWQVGH